ncbi:hypothetical protein Pelo_10464 [Pelomyxa schiedti]|nr:hypothetical protein Pelo_10464 [Pelomyxa schiedti]
MATFGGFPGFGTPSTPAPLWPPATPSAATPAWSATPSTPAVSSALFSTTPAVQNQPPPIMGGSAATATATRLAWGMKFSDLPPQYADVLVKIQDQIFASRAHTWDTRTVNALDKVSAENRAVMERTKPLKEAIDSDRLRVTNLSNQILEKRRLLDQARITIHSMQSSSFHSDELRPDPFFLQLANELETRICQCELQLKEIDDIFKASAAATGTASNLHTLLSDNYKLLLAIGKQVASTHEEVIFFYKFPFTL